MRGKILLRDPSIEGQFKYGFMLDDEENTYEIEIASDLSESFLSLISTTGDMANSIHIARGMEPDEHARDMYKWALKNQLKLLQRVEYVEFDYPVEQVHEYISKNPILKSKKIIIRCFDVLNSEELKKIESLFCKDTDNIYVAMPENLKLVSFKEFHDTIMALDNIIADINRFPFSPMEKIMYAYDIVRNRVYVPEANDESFNVSRDLSSSLLGEKIVCLGFTRILKAILDRLGFLSRKSYLEPTDGSTEGHVRNEVYVYDPKYNIDGVYSFDATWDSKKEDSDDYLLSYRFFAKTKREMEEIDYPNLTDKLFPPFNDDLLDDLKSIPFEELPKETLKTVNSISLFFFGEMLISILGLPPYNMESFKVDKDEVVEKIAPYIAYYNKPLAADTLLQVLYNVRKIQYYIDPDKYPFSLDDFYKTVVRSKWEFQGTPEERLMAFLVTGKDKQMLLGNKLIWYASSTNMDKEIEQVKLTRTLRKVLEKQHKY